MLPSLFPFFLSRRGVKIAVHRKDLTDSRAFEREKKMQETIEWICFDRCFPDLEESWRLKRVRTQGQRFPK